LDNYYQTIATAVCQTGGRFEFCKVLAGQKAWDGRFFMDRRKDLARKNIEKQGLRGFRGVEISCLARPTAWLALIKSEV